MALEGYYNLKEKKKNIILQAIRTCLTHKGYDEISVNDIVLEAGIARGSFYNYFADKNDAVKTLVDSSLEKYFMQYKDAIIDSNYNLFKGTIKEYSNIKEILKNELNMIVMRNMKFFMELISTIIHSKEYEKDYDAFVEWVYQNTIEGKSKKFSKIEMGSIIDIILMLIINSVFTEIVFNPNSESKYKNFEYKLSLLQKGIC